MGILTSILPARGAIAESELRGAEAWLMDMGGSGFSTNAGVRVDEGNAITLSGVFACARALSEDVACLPLKVYRRLRGGGKESAADDPIYAGVGGQMINLYRLVHDTPNEDMDDLTFRSLLIWWALLYGNAFAEVVRVDGRPVALQPIHPMRVNPMRDDGGVLFYRVKQGPGIKDADLMARDTIHLRGPSNDGVVGHMITRLAKESFGVYMAAERYTGKFFGSGATLAGVVEIDAPFKSQESRELYRESFNKTYGNAAQGNQWFVADGGAKVKTLGVDPEKSQLTETLQFRIEDVARWFRVPPVVIGHNTNTPYTNVEALGKYYTSFAMKPWALRIEKEFGRKLIGYDEPDLFIEHVIDALMWADSKTRAEYHNSGIRGGWRSPNEVRDVENMNPIPGGDRYRIEQNLALLDEDGKPEQANQPAPTPEPQPAEQDMEDDNRRDAEAIKAMMMPVFVDAAERMIAREVNALTSRKKITREWLDEFYKGHHEQVALAFAAPLASLGRLLGADVTGIANRYADQHVGESKRGLAAGEDLKAWATSRPAWIAKHLTDEASNV